MSLKAVLHSDRGQLLIAILLGFGLSTLFRKSCTKASCMKFRAPPMDKINGQIYEYNTKCYRFEGTAADCSSKRKTVRFA